jgi:hypothetical protein
MAKISVNQLAKFLTSNSAKHRTIIKDLINPLAFKVNYYEKAQSGIREFLLDQSANEEILIKAIECLNAIVPQTEESASSRDNNIEALDSFLMTLEKIQFIDSSNKITPNKPCPRVVIDDVEISVFPECIFTGQIKKKNCIGAIKLYFSKSERLDDAMGAYIGGVTKQFLTEQYPNYTVQDNLVQIIDVFGKTIYSAPKAFKRRMDEIKAACAEIKLWWNFFT